MGEEEKRWVEKKRDGRGRKEMGEEEKRWVRKKRDG